MKNRSNLLRPLLALAAGCALFSSASAFKFILNDDTGIPVKWPAGTVPLTLKLGTKDSIDFNPVAKAAADLWNARLGSLQFTSTVGTTGAPSTSGSINELGFASDVFGKAFETNVLAVTTSFSRGNERTSSDITFNSASSWGDYRGAIQSKIDLRRVTLHELGHVLGLDHPDEGSPAQNVVAIMNSHVGSLDTLADDDIQGAQSLYGPPGVPANNNFANAVTIDFNSGNLTVSGYNTNATKETGEPNHAGNVGGRSVWYRWKPNGSASVIIDTKGSYYDTTLAVYTGTTLSALTSVASSDDIQDGIIQASSVSFNVTGGTTYYIAVDGFSNDANGADNAAFKLNLNLTGVVLVAPTITTQPASLTVTAGQSVSFTVAVTGSDPISYQWLFNGLVITGATDSSFSINSAQALNAGKYSVKVTNPQGSVTSSEATLTVNAAAPTTPTPPSGGGGGGGGGGGAPSVWFVAVLAALGLGRLLSRRTP